MIVVYGSTSSGKSNIAENIAVSVAQNRENLYYIATMENKSETAKERIAHHRQLRDGKGFITIEEELNPECPEGVALLECVSNLVANVLFAEYGEKIIPEEKCDELALDIFGRIDNLGRNCKLVVVTNNVFGTGHTSDEWCDRYMRILGRVNELLADRCDCFVEVTAGIANVIKGEVDL